MAESWCMCVGGWVPLTPTPPFLRIPYGLKIIGWGVQELTLGSSDPSVARQALPPQVGVGDKGQGAHIPSKACTYGPPDLVTLQVCPSGCGDQSLWPTEALIHSFTHSISTSLEQPLCSGDLGQILPPPVLTAACQVQMDKLRGKTACPGSHSK